MRLKCNLCLVLAATLLASVPALCALGDEPGTWLDGVTSVFEAETPRLMHKYHVPGVSIAVAEKGEIAWSRQYGVANVKQQNPVTETTLFEACSMSKPLFAYGVLQLVEQGRLMLDKPLVDYLEQPYVKDDELHKKITARMVLSHTSGLPNWRKGQLKNPVRPRPLYEPGSRFTYSGEGYTFLQIVVEKITGQPLDVFMDESVLVPIKMTHSNYRWSEYVETHAAAGHDKQGQLKTSKRRFTNPNAAYTLFTTPSEYALYLIEMMRPDRSAEHSLSAAMLRSMLSRQSPGKSEGRWYGLGWAINAQQDGDQFYHGGANGTGFRCFCWFDSQTQRGIVIMTNAIGGAQVHETLMQAAKVLPGEAK